MSEEKQSLQACVTFPNRAMAISCGRFLVMERLAAGINILGPVYSIYHWKNNIQEHEEWILLAQLTSDNFDAFKKAILNRHPYVAPCVIGLDIAAGHQPFLEWIASECRRGQK